MKADLYILGNDGNIRHWSCETSPNGLIINFGLLGGAVQSKEENIYEGKSVRSVEEQIELRFNSRVNKQLQRGYSYSLIDALHKPRNELGLHKPMLAQVYDKKYVDWKHAFIQRKYNGLRCLICNHNGELVIYSRNGKILPGTAHLADEIELAQGMTVDGELYSHGTPFQVIQSWAKRNQPGSERLSFYAYDVVNEQSFEKRIDILREWLPEKYVVPTRRVMSHDDAVECFMQYRSEDYEGAIIRQGTVGYEDGKRSRSLLKLKAWLDAEFEVIAIKPSKDGWAILTCELPDGDTFDVSAPGNINERALIMEEADKYIGRYVNVEYANLTEDGIPFQPIARYWRT